MNLLIKDRVKCQLEKGCFSLYGIGLDACGELVNREGKPLKWAFRDSKAHEPWSFSITIAMSLAPVVKRPAEVVAEELIFYLREKIAGPWRFCSAKGYINVYFKPKCLRDYLEDKEAFNWQALETLRDGSYVHYRLQVLQRALEARGVGWAAEDIWDRPLNEHGLSVLFDFPEKSNACEAQWVKPWEKWLTEVVGMTRVGHLRNLSTDGEEVLLSFIKACLN